MCESAQVYVHLRVCVCVFLCDITCELSVHTYVRGRAFVTHKLGVKMSPSPKG